jgi:hypothetical protein
MDDVGYFHASVFRIIVFNSYDSFLDLVFPSLLSNRKTFRFAGEKEKAPRIA